MATCNYCGAEIGSNISTCPNCGSSITSSTENKTEQVTYKPAKKVRRAIAMGLFIASAAILAIVALLGMYIGLSALAMLDDMILMMQDSYSPEMLASIEALGWTIEGITIGVVIGYIVIGFLSLFNAICNGIMAVLSMLIPKKKIMLPLAIVSIVINVCCMGGILGIVPGILLLAAPKSEFKG